uniref:Uncharacterized protein n=1 Tax=Alexandrium catenella TaxID=2925 RepID=A0A7S1M720_ALECA
MAVLEHAMGQLPASGTVESDTFSDAVANARLRTARASPEEPRTQRSQAGGAGPPCGRGLGSAMAGKDPGSPGAEGEGLRQRADDVGGFTTETREEPQAGRSQGAAAASEEVEAPRCEEESGAPDSHLLFV